MNIVKKISKLKNIILTTIIFCLLWQIYTVSAQNGTDSLENRIISITFPFAAIPDGSIETEIDETTGRDNFTDSTILFFREYFKAVLNFPREMTDTGEDGFDGPEFAHSDGLYQDKTGQLVYDQTLIQDPVRDWMCKIQEPLDDIDRVTSEDPFCTYPNFDLQEDLVCSKKEQGARKALNGKNGKDLLFPILLDPPIKSEDQAVIGYRFKESTYYQAEAPKGHAGLDFLYPTGTPIVAMNYGKVIVSSMHASTLTSVDGNKGFGNYVIINHEMEDGTFLQTTYAHMSERKVTVGQIVSPGDVIGLVGITGRTRAPVLDENGDPTGELKPPKPHLHLEVKICSGFADDGSCENRKLVDPEKYITYDINDLLPEDDVSCIPEALGGGNSSGGSGSFFCLLGNAANAVGNLPREALYAIAQNEGRSCPLTWASWYGIESYRDENGNTIMLNDDTDLNSLPSVGSGNLTTKPNLKDRTACTGDPLQIAQASFNLYNPNKANDVRGISQFTASTFNSQLKVNDENGNNLMEKCVKALGGNIDITVPTDECRTKITNNCLKNNPYYDNLSDKPNKFSRHIVSHVVCAKAIKISRDAGNISVDQWNEQTMYRVAHDYIGHGNLPDTDKPACNEYSQGSSDGDYCDKAVSTYKSATPDLFVCNGGSKPDPVAGKPNNAGENTSASGAKAKEIFNSNSTKVGYYIELDKSTIVQNSSNYREKLQNFVNDSGVCAAINTNFYHTDMKQIGLFKNQYNSCPSCPSRDFIDVAILSYSGGITRQVQDRLIADLGNNIILVKIYDESKSDPTGGDNLFDGMNINWSVSGHLASNNGIVQENNTRAAPSPYLGISETGEIYIFAFSSALSPANQVSAIQSIKDVKMKYLIFLDAGGSTQMYVKGGSDSKTSQTLIQSDRDHYFIGAKKCG